MGNIFARRPGTDDSLTPVMTGSHFDTQPTGGKFDGTLGVMFGLEVLRVLHDRGLRTKRPIEVVAWTDEEGSRFASPMVGSGVFAGLFDLDYGLSRQDMNDVTIGQELERIGYAGTTSLGHQENAYIEAHIEQGPILEAERKTIGVVSGAQAHRWYEITLTGQEAHAGTTPMERRRDALVGAANIITEVSRLARPPWPTAGGRLEFWRSRQGRATPFPAKSSSRWISTIRVMMCSRIWRPTCVSTWLGWPRSMAWGLRCTRCTRLRRRSSMPA